MLHLKEYIKEFHPKFEEEALFFSLLDGRSHRLSTDSISLILKTAAQKARKSCSEVPKRVNCHMIIKAKVMD